MFKSLSLLALVASLAACGTSKVDRAISGGALGATAGVVGAAVADRDAVSGALLGGLVGAAAGSLTTNQSINLGEPIFRSGY